jgi:hypothetical protein
MMAMFRQLSLLLIALQMIDIGWPLRHFHTISYASWH